MVLSSDPFKAMYGDCVTVEFDAEGSTKTGARPRIGFFNRRLVAVRKDSRGRLKRNKAEIIAKEKGTVSEMNNATLSTCAKRT